MIATVRTRPLYRLLYKRLRLPRHSVHALLGGAKRQLLRTEVKRREALAQRLATELAPDTLRLDPGTACSPLAVGALAGAAGAAAHARALLASYRGRGGNAAALQRNPAKAFLLSVLSGPAFAEHPSLLALMLSRPLLDAASIYLGTVPRLEGAALWWTPPNDSVRASQAWHIDELAPRQVKVILNCVDVGAEQGPLHYLPADVSDQVRADARHRRGRLADEAVAGHAAVGSESFADPRDRAVRSAKRST